VGGGAGSGAGVFGAGSGGAAGSGAGTGGSAGGGAGTAGSGGISGNCMNPATLKEAGMCAGRPIGVALAERYMDDMDYVENARQFNYVTPEDEMKWDATEPTRGNFTFGQADTIVDFAEANGMAVKGHTLLWHNQLPSWLTSINNATQLRAAMVDHINGLMDYYKGKVVAWDVVNEAWDDSGGLRDSVWSRVIGQSFIEEAFRAARAADPTVKLYYNDYDIESDYPKADAVYAMAQDFVARGVPIDGIGMQMHTRTADIDPPIPEFVANIDRFIALGLDVVLSEMDVRLCADGTFEKQAQRYHDIIAVCVARPKCTAITFWGISDRYSFLNARTDLECQGSEPPRPLLWTDDYVKKPAFQSVIDALVGR
jgi:endo-1,4-beta-xylanase